MEKYTNPQSYILRPHLLSHALIRKFMQFSLRKGLCGPYLQTVKRLDSHECFPSQGLENLK